MSYSPYSRNANRSSGIVFFGERGDSDVLTSDTNFLLEDGAAGNIQAPNFKVADGGQIGSVSAPTAITIASNGSVTTSSNLSVTGDLTVNGTTTTVNSTVTTIEDPLIIIGDGAGNGYGAGTDDNKDRGIAFAWNNNNAVNGQLGFFGHDDSKQRFVYYTSGVVTNDVVSNFSIGDAEFRWGLFHAVSGDLTGNADTSTTLETSRNFSITGEGTATAQTFNGSQNVALPFVLDKTAITNQTDNGAAAGGDFLLIVDVSDSNNLKKVTKTDFVSDLGGGTMSDFNISDGSTSELVEQGNTITFTGGTGLDSDVSATDTVTFSVSDNGITATQLNSSVAGNGLTGGGGTALAVGAGSLIDVTANTVDVDLTEAAAATIADGDFLIFLDGGTAGAESKGDTSDLATLLGGNGLTVTNSTLSVNAGNGLVLNGNAVDLDFSELSAVAVAAGDSFAVLDSNGTTEQRATVDQLGTYLAGDNITNTAGVLSVADSDIEAAIFTTANFVDGTTVNFTVTAGASVTAEVQAIDTTHITAAALVTAADTIASNDNDTSWPTTAAVIDYVAAQVQPTLTTEEVQDIVGAQLDTNGSHTLITATYDDAGDGAIDLVVDNDLANYSNTNSAFITASSTDTLTNKTFNANGTGNSISNIEVADLAGSAVVTEGEGIASNDNDTTLPTSAAVKDYVDSNAASALKTVVTDTADETLLDGEDVCLADATAGNMTITLPGVDSGRQVTVKKTDSSANTVTVTGATGNIDGAANVILYSENESVTLVCDATNWFVI